MKLDVDVISDGICPWCFIGKRRFEKVVAVLEGQHEIRVRWLPFQLNPAMPKEGLSRQEYRTRKFGSWERSLELDAQVAAVGTTEGIHFALDRIERTPNTLDAHRLIWLADQRGCQNAVVEALFQAYFTDGRNISDRPTLLDVVAAAGLERQQAEGLLDSDLGMEAIQETEELSRRLQVGGVPHFIINQQVMLSGAQPPTVFLEAIRQTVGSQSIKTQRPPDA